MSLDRMQILNLNHCAITTFVTIQWIADTMPNLTSLCIANNDLSDLSNYEIRRDSFNRLQKLDCSNCHFDSWQGQVDKFGILPVLEWLNLDDNRIPSIPMNAGDNFQFPCLTTLQLSGTTIATWKDLEGITSLSSLNGLRIKNVPLTLHLGPAEVRWMCIARYPQLDILNGSLISTLERTEAEKRYVSMVSHMLLMLSQQQQDVQSQNVDNHNGMEVNNDSIILQEHPRFVELKEKYQNLVIGSGGRGSNKNHIPNLASSIVNVTIQSMAPSSCTMDPVLRRLPDTLTVGRLKALCSRLFGGSGGNGNGSSRLDYDLIQLRFCNHDHDSLPMDLEDDDKMLNYYGVSDGAVILMDEIDVVQQDKDWKQKQAEQERRMADHDRTITAMKEWKRMG